MAIQECLARDIDSRDRPTVASHTALTARRLRVPQPLLLIYLIVVKSGLITFHTLLIEIKIIIIIFKNPWRIYFFYGG